MHRQFLYTLQQETVIARHNDQMYMCFLRKGTNLRVQMGDGTFESRPLWRDSYVIAKRAVLDGGLNHLEVSALFNEKDAAISAFRQEVDAVTFPDGKAPVHLDFNSKMLFRPPADNDNPSPRPKSPL